MKFRWFKKHSQPGHRAQRARVKRSVYSRIDLGSAGGQLLPDYQRFVRQAVPGREVVRSFQRKKESHYVSPKDIAKRLREKQFDVWRLPIIGFRSQTVGKGLRQSVRKFQKIGKFGQLVLDRPEDAKRTVCDRRAVRREVLFKMRIAGRGLRRSPGQGGHYRRNQDSEKVCRRS